MNIAKRCCALIFAVIMVLSMVPMSALAADTTNTTITVDTSKVTLAERNKNNSETLQTVVVPDNVFAVNDAFYVPVIVSNLESFDGYNLQMIYNTNVLRFDGAFTAFTYVNSDGDEVTFAKTQLFGTTPTTTNEGVVMGVADPSGNGQVVTIDYDSKYGYLFFAKFTVVGKTTNADGKETIGIQAKEGSAAIGVGGVANGTTQFVSGTISVETESSGGESGGTTTSSDYEIWYELDSTADTETTPDNYKEYDISTDAGKTVTATLYIKNTGAAPVSLQAYDIYLTHDSKLTAGTFIPTNDNKGVAKTTDGKFHIQAIGENDKVADINIELQPNVNVVLGTIPFTINSTTAQYDEGLFITLTDNSQTKAQDSTNIGYADYEFDENGATKTKEDGTKITTGNKNAAYPTVGGTTQGAEVNTKYVVTYDANNGTWQSGTAPTQTKYHNVAMTLDPGATPTREGWAFKGWATTPNATANDCITVLPADVNEADTKLYAVWEQTSFTVEWFGTDGTVIETDNNVAYGATAEFNGTEPSKTVEGYTVEFLGWNTDPDAVAALTDLKITGATKFYPIFKETINQYEVTFDADGGTLADGASTTVKQDYNTPITLPNATKTGHTLEGWYDGTEKVGTAGGSYTIKKNVELKAEWTVDTYTIKYMDGTTEMTGLTPVSYTFGVGATLPTKDTVTKPAYTFAGWYNNEGLTGDVVTTIAADATGPKTYWAKWTDNEYTITSVANPTDGGTVSAVNSDNQSGASGNMNDTINVTVTPHPGYDIDKVTWAPENGDAKDIKITDGSGSFTMPAANVTVTATFKKVDLAVTKDDAIDSDEGSVTVKKNDEDTETDKAQIEDTINLTVTPENGYQVKEVSYSYTDKDGKEVKTTITNPVNDVYTFTMPGYTVEVSAIFEPIEYTITYMDGKSKIENLSPAKYTVESEQITLPSATKLGYDFKGWYTEPEFTNVVTTLTPADAEDKTYYAKFEIIEYTITYMDGSDPISGLIPNTYTVETGTVTLATYIKNGYTFEGWYDNAGFTGTAVATFNSMDVGNKTFYAKLTPITYTIKFVVPNGTAIADLTYTIESDYTLPEATNSNSLYTFKNWLASDAEGSWTNTEYNKGTEVKGKYGNVTLTAQWNEVLTYDIQEYKYAGSNQLMLLIATDSNTNAYTFDGETMFYSADTGYQIDKIENETTVKKNVFVTLISSEYVQDVDGIKRLTADGMAKVGPGTAAAADIRINGDINNDSVVNIADANIVYQMIVNGGGYYSADLLTADRLAADMVKDDNAVHRAAINDVNEIVNKINGTTTTNP